MEPFGAEVLGLAVAETTAMTALWAGGMLAAFALASRVLGGRRDLDPHRLAAIGALAGIVGFAAVIFSSPLQAASLMAAGVGIIGFGCGLFSVGTLTVAMDLARGPGAGLALGAWGAVNATAAGLGMLVAGIVRDIGAGLAASGSLGPALSQPSTPYLLVWHAEIGLLFLTLAALGPLVRRASGHDPGPPRPFGLAEFPA
jgi:BCD family chlorophyll transporter-like MFS transporter